MVGGLAHGKSPGVGAMFYECYITLLNLITGVLVPEEGALESRVEVYSVPDSSRISPGGRPAWAASC